MKHKEEVNSDMENKKKNAENVPLNEQELPDAESEETDKTSKLEAEITVANDKYLRLYSDFENYKRRMNKDRIDQMKMAGADIFLSFLPVIDDFERAIKSMEDAKDVQPVKEGISLIYSKFKNMTASKGLKEMESVGKPFDPELHDAIANMPVNDEDKKGTVIEEIERGYYLNDKVIRHAKVIVGN